MSPERGRSVKVLSVPRPLGDNPYQTLLYRAYEGAGGTLLGPHSFTRSTLRSHAGPDRVVHVHWLWLKGGRVRRFLRSRRLAGALEQARSLGWRVVWTAHNVYPHEDTAEDQWLAEKLALLADGVIVHTQAAGATLRAAFDVRCPVRVIPHGHYRDAYPAPIDRAEAREKLNLTDDRPIVLAFGQVRPYKGFQDLVARFRQSDLDATLIIAGNPSDHQAAAVLRTGAADDPRIRLDLRFHDPDETSVLFSAADRVVLPYRQVTTSGALVLALSFGRTCVIPDDAALLEICGEETVERFTSRDDLVPALERSLAADAGPRERAASACADKLTWGPIGKATLEFFCELTAEGPRH